jgi:hypothetical protein
MRSGFGQDYQQRISVDTTKMYKGMRGRKRRMMIIESRRRT